MGSVEFARHRLHNVGDSIKISVTGKCCRAGIAEKFEENQFALRIVIDASSSMLFTEEKLNRLSFLCRLLR